MASDSKTTDSTARDYRDTIFLPETPFPMKAGLPQREPEWLARWEKMDLYRRLREDAKGRDTFILHDGPPYANGDIHIGHALNKTLKDIVVRSQQMMGKDAAYIPGWDCHGLPIEWKIEEKYRKKGQNKDEVPPLEFRRECREFAQHWVDVQREQFKRLGVSGDWDNPYLTMSYDAEAAIVREFQKFLMNGSLYRGSKPVMWSIVEKTALAEAEVEYADHVSRTIFVKFDVRSVPSDVDASLAEKLQLSNVVIWTTTPWTIPGNRAIAFSDRSSYGLYQVESVLENSLAQVGERLVLADSLVDQVKGEARIEICKRLGEVPTSILGRIICNHPLSQAGNTAYSFPVPLFAADFVTEETGTGFVHIAPGHGQDDYGLWISKRRELVELGIDPKVPDTVNEEGVYYPDVPLFAGKFVLTRQGKEGTANAAVIEELQKVGKLLAQGKLTHSYPHSWRSKAPLIFRNTAQWFVSMDAPIPQAGGRKLREVALSEIDKTRWVPARGRNRIHSMVEGRPDWVLSRQRAWGVPLTIFVHKTDGSLLRDEKVNARVVEAVAAEGADAWFEKPVSYFLEGSNHNAADYDKVTDILDVWFDSGSTHAFVLEGRGLPTPADLYLEGSDQHRGWFQSSLLESCGTRGRAPYRQVLTHGMTLTDKGLKMSKSLGNAIEPEAVIKQNGADILRLWVASTDYWDDHSIGNEILKSNVEAYRKLRNTFRYLLGNLAGFEEAERVALADMPELERSILHKLAELDELVRKAYDDYDFKRIFHALSNFMNIDLSAFYFDIRKDTLYCDAPSSIRRRACRTVLHELFMCLTAWFAPILCFTTEEVWLTRFPSEDGSVHLRLFPAIPADWRDEALAEKWRKVRELRRVVTGALEVERREKRIGASLEAAPDVYVSNAELRAAMAGLDLAEIAITSQASLIDGEGPAEAFRLDDVPGVAVVPKLAQGRKCARSWKILPEVGSVPGFPDLTPRDAAAVMEYDARHKSA